MPKTDSAQRPIRHYGPLFATILAAAAILARLEPDSASPLVPGWQLLQVFLLLSGSVQFLNNARNRGLAVHRRLGQIYIVGVLLSASLCVWLSPPSPWGGSSAGAAAVFAVLWSVTTLIAYRAIRKYDLPRHRDWMLRSFALTLAPALPIALRMFNSGTGLAESFLIEWGFWLPFATAVELYLQQTRSRAG